MITELTEEQKSRFPEFVKRWTEIGLSTELVNRKEAEEGVKLAYKIAGLKEPKIVWCGSPVSQGLTRAIILGLKNSEIKIGASVRDSVVASVWASVRDSVGDSVGDSVRDNVRDSVRDSVRDNVRDSVGDSVRDNVRDNVWDSVGDSVRDNVRDNVWDSVGDSVVASVRASVWASVGASVRDSVRDSVVASVWASVGDSVRDSVVASVGDNVVASVGDSVVASVRDSVVASVGDSVGASVRDSVVASVVASVRDSVVASVWASGYGQHDSAWIGFYDYFKIACGLELETQKLTGIQKITENAGWWLPYEKICWISERHNILKRDSKGRLHCEEGPAVGYPDGWEIYALNGVRMKKEHVMTRSEDLDPKMILSETNVEVRRELIRKIGVERFIQAAGARVIDKPLVINEPYKTEYSLLSVDLSDDHKDEKFLKMLNPSIGVWHVEAVAPNCKTVREALHFRKPKKLRDIPVDDVNGEDYVIQGDVILWPREAKSVKFFPAQLT